MFAQLVPLDGGEAVTINKDITVVGRQSEHCDLVLTRKSVSKIHCVIAKTDGLLFVRDLDSTNGTKVNGQRIVRGALLPGDQLAFAGEKFKVHLGPSPQTPQVSEIHRTEVIDDESPLSEGFGDASMPSLLFREPGPRAAEDLVE